MILFLSHSTLFPLPANLRVSSGTAKCIQNTWRCPGSINVCTYFIAFSVAICSLMRISRIESLDKDSKGKVKKSSKRKGKLISQCEIHTLEISIGLSFPHLMRAKLPLVFKRILLQIWTLPSVSETLRFRHRSVCEKHFHTRMRDGTRAGELMVSLMELQNRCS